jgi:hypothetical protein
MVSDRVKAMFCLQGGALQLPGGSRPAYRLGQVVVKQLHTRQVARDRTFTRVGSLAGRRISRHRREGLSAFAPHHGTKCQLAT